MSGYLKVTQRFEPCYQSPVDLITDVSKMLLDQQFNRIVIFSVIANLLSVLKHKHPIDV